MRARMETMLSVKAGISEIIDALEVAVKAGGASELCLDDVSRIDHISERYRERMEMADKRRANLLKTQRTK